jgi:hypothetical protein
VTVDHLLPGLVRVRLLDPEPRDAAAVARQLGPTQAPVAGEADLTIRFVDRIAPSSRLRLLGAHEAAFTDDGFLVLRAKHKARARVLVPLDRVGRPCEVVCEHGAPAVPLLIPILNLTVLAGGSLPLHAAAFVDDGVGAVVTGWSKGGKTEALLSFVDAGATYVGDEWVYLSGDGRTVTGIPEPIRVWDSHLRTVPHHWRNVPLGARARLRSIRAARDLVDRLPPGARRSKPGRLAERALPLLEGQAHVDLAPAGLLGATAGAASGPFDRLFWVVSAERPDIVVEQVDPRSVAERMVFSLQYERLDLMGWYHRFRYAFPDAANPLLETAEELERKLLLQVVDATPAWLVEHPYPVDIPALHDAMSPCLR